VKGWGAGVRGEGVGVEGEGVGVEGWGVGLRDEGVGVYPPFLPPVQVSRVLSVIRTATRNRRPPDSPTANGVRHHSTFHGDSYPGRSPFSETREREERREASRVLSVIRTATRNRSPEMCSGSEAGSHLRLIDS